MRVCVGGCRGSRWIGWMGARVGSIALSRVYLVLPSPLAHARGMLRTLPCVSARAWIASLVRSLPLLLVRHVWFAFPPTLARVADPRDRSHRGHPLCSRGGSIFPPRMAKGERCGWTLGFPFLGGEQKGRRSGSNPDGRPFRKGTSIEGMQPSWTKARAHETTCAHEHVARHATTRRARGARPARMVRKKRRKERTCRERRAEEERSMANGTKDARTEKGWTKHRGVVADEACRDGSHVCETDEKKRGRTMQSHVTTVDVAWNVETPGGKTQTQVPCGKTASSVGSLDCMALWR